MENNENKKSPSFIKKLIDGLDRKREKDDLYRKRVAELDEKEPGWRKYHKDPMKLTDKEMEESYRETALKFNSMPRKERENHVITTDETGAFIIMDRTEAEKLWEKDHPDWR